MPSRLSLGGRAPSTPLPLLGKTSSPMTPRGTALSRAGSLPPGGSQTPRGTSSNPRASLGGGLTPRGIGLGDRSGALTSRASLGGSREPTRGSMTARGSTAADVRGSMTARGSAAADARTGIPRSGLSMSSCVQQISGMTACCGGFIALPQRCLIQQSNPVILSTAQDVQAATQNRPANSSACWHAQLWHSPFASRHAAALQASAHSKRGGHRQPEVRRGCRLEESCIQQGEGPCWLEAQPDQVCLTVDGWQHRPCGDA